jgi:hypothetical protein
MAGKLASTAERFFLKHDHWRLRRFRRAYTKVSGQRSGKPGYAGLIEELRWGLEQLDPRTRERADEAVLRESFYGPLALAVLGTLGRVDSKRVARLLASGAPISLRFLVGEIERSDDEPTVNHVPDCRFRREGGERLCREVCQRPTEAFARARGLPIVFEPHAEGHACRWTWGQTRTP